MDIKTGHSGFTLIEIITAIAIMGIIGGFGSIFLMNMFQSYQLADNNAHLAQKAQVALTRIAVEMAYADKDSINVSGNIITYDATYPVDGALEQETGNMFKQIGNSLIYENDNDQYVLADFVDSFVVNVDNWGHGYFEISLTMTGANNVEQVFNKTMSLP